MKLGRYNLLRRVGTGGMAEVWKANLQGPAGFEKTVAIKRVLPHLSADDEFTGMFIEEAKLVARLAHPNIVQVLDFGLAERPGASSSPSDDPDGSNADYYIAMEYVSGQNLASVLKRLADRRITLPPDLALYIAAEAAKALGYAHGETDPAGRALGIVHRDISPHNILVSYRGEVKVTDFGIAKVASALPRTATGVWKGKISYMSPEQIALAPLDGRSDIFCLGLVLYELLTGKRLFGGSSAEEIYARIKAFDPAAPPVSEVAEPVRELLQRALQVDPAHRFADATRMEAELSWALGAGGALQARSALAALLQEHFRTEQDRELGEAAVEEEGTQQAGPTGTVVSAGRPGGGQDGNASGSGLTFAPKQPSVTIPPPSSPEGPAGGSGRTDTWMRMVAESERDEARTHVGAGTSASPAPAALGAGAAELVASAPEPHATPGETTRTAVSPPSRTLEPDAPRIGEAPVPNLAPGVPGPRDPNATLLEPDQRRRAGGEATRVGAAWPRPGEDAQRDLPAEKPQKPAWVFAAGAGALALLAGAAGLAGGRLIGGRDEAPAATVAVLAASPDATAAPLASSIPTSTGDASTAATPAPAATSVASAPTARSHATPHAAATSARTPAPPAATPTRVASTAPITSGTLTVFADPWVEVYVDGKRIAAETPLKRHRLPAGPHKVRVVNPHARFSAERTIEVPKNRDVRIDVNVGTRTVSVR